jgi:hypothetical protein
LYVSSLPVLQHSEPIEIVEAKPRGDCAALAGQTAAFAGTTSSDAGTARGTFCGSLTSCDLDPAAAIGAVAGIAKAALDLSSVTQHTSPGTVRQRLDVDPAEVRKGLGQLVLTLVRLLHEVLERQAIRRMDSGTLTEQQVDKLGSTLMLQAEEITKLAKDFGVDESDLNLDLGPLGKLM